MYLWVDGRCKPLSMKVIAGRRGDSPEFEAVLGKIAVRDPRGGPVPCRPGAVLADKAYFSKANRAYPSRRGIKALSRRRPIGPPPASTKAPRAADPSATTSSYKARNSVERYVGRLKQWRGIAMRSDKLGESYEAGLLLASVVIWIRST